MKLNLVRYKAGFFPKAFSDVLDFVRYCELHSETPRALFSREQVQQLCFLAGMSSPVNLTGWQSVDLTDVCTIVRTRLQDIAEVEVIDALVRKHYSDATGRLVLDRLDETLCLLSGQAQAKVIIGISEALSELVQETILPTDIDKILSELLLAHEEATVSDFARVIQAVLVGSIRVEASARAA